MSNPITPTVVTTLIVTDTSATGAIFGGAIGATVGTGGIKAGPIVSSSSITDSVGSMATIRAGGLGLASQGTLDVMKSSSSSQWARLAVGAALQYLRVNGGATDLEWGSIAPTLIKEGTGTSSSAGATNVDTFALASTLTIKDALLIFVRHRNSGNAANIIPIVYNSTDSVTAAALSTANNNYYVDVVFIGAQSTTRVGSTTLVFTSGALSATRAAFTTAYTGAWTLALRHGGVTAPDTWEWEWAVYKIAGQ